MAQFKQVNHKLEYWKEYRELADQLTKELGEQYGVTISIPEAIHLAVTFYKQRRKLPEYSESHND